jgi:hypothetical protein
MARRPQGAWADKFDAPLIVNPRPARRYERKPIVFLSAVSLLIVVVVGGLIFWLVRPSSDTDSTPPSLAPTTPSPDADRLLRLVPVGYPSDACKPVSAPKDALGQVSCEKNSDAGGPVLATYTFVDNKAALDVAFNGIIQASTMVNCPGNIQSPGPWRRNATPDKTRGVLFCGVQDGRPTVAWIDEVRLVLSEVQSSPQRPTFDELCAMVVKPLVAAVSAWRYWRNRRHRRHRRRGRPLAASRQGSPCRARRNRCSFSGG